MTTTADEPLYAVALMRSLAGNVNAPVELERVKLAHDIESATQIAREWYTAERERLKASPRQSRRVRTTMHDSRFAAEIVDDVNAVTTIRVIDAVENQ